MVSKKKSGDALGKITNTLEGILQKLKDWGIKIDKESEISVNAVVLERKEFSDNDPWTETELREDLADIFINDAYDSDNGKERVRLAEMAMSLFKDNADAYLLLAEEKATNLAQKLEYLRQGVEAGERSLGPKMFKEDKGHFWGILETRPYMRTRFNRMLALDESGRVEEAIAEAKALLELSESDNLGARYILSGMLMKLGRFDELGKLLGRYDDSSAEYQYARVLLAFAQSGGSGDVIKRLEAAIKENPYAAEYLVEQNKPGRDAEDIDSYVSGSKEEGRMVAYRQYDGWKNTPGALDWLRNIVRPEVSKAVKIGRNDPCPCGSGKKYKKCCYIVDELKEMHEESKVSGRRLDDYMALLQFVGMFAAKEQQFGIYAEYLMKLFDYVDKRYYKHNKTLELPESIHLQWYYLDLKYGVEKRSIIERLLDEGMERELNSPGPEQLREMAASYHSFYEIISISVDKMTVRELITGVERIVHSYGDSYDKDRKAGEVWFMRLVGPTDESYLLGSPLYYDAASKQDIEKTLWDMMKEALSIMKPNPDDDASVYRVVMKSSILFLAGSFAGIIPERREELPYGLVKKGKILKLPVKFRNEDGDEMIFTRSVYTCAGAVLGQQLRIRKDFNYDKESGYYLWIHTYKIKGQKTNIAIGRARIEDERVICDANSAPRAKELGSLLANIPGAGLKPELTETINDIF